jgi:predicted RND superfamily exporter protein
VRDQFGTEDPIVVVIRTQGPDGVFDVRIMQLVQTLMDKVPQLEGIEPSNITSLATEYTDRVKPGTLKFRRFLEPFPSTQEDLNRIRGDLRALELYTGTVVSYDGSATALFVGVPPEANRTELYGRIRDLVASCGEVPAEIHVIGAPVAEALLGTHILEDLGVPSALLGHSVSGPDEGQAWRMPRSWYEFRRLIGRHIGLVPVALIIMIAVFAVSFRSPTAAVLPLMEVGACLIFVFGLMGWCGVPIYLTIAVLPVILTAIGVADEIHVFSTYVANLRPEAGADHLATLHATMDEMWVPVVKTSVTTAVGFLSFALSSIGPVRVFGVFTAVGIMFCMVWSLTVIPALLTVINPRRFVPLPAAGGVGPDEPAGRNARRPLLSRMAGMVLRHRYAVLGLAALIAVAAPLGVRRVVVQDSWIDGFAPDSEFYQATQMFNDQFLGTHILLVDVDTGHYELTGEVTGADVDHHTVRLPTSLADDPQTLVGNRIDLLRTGPPRILREAPRRYQLPNSWGSLVESVAVDGDDLVATFPRRAGSPKLSLRLEPAETLVYTIRPYALMRPQVLERLGEFEAFLGAQDDCAVGGVLGPARYMATTNFMVRARKEGSRRIPDSPRQIRENWAHYRRVRGEDRLQQLLDADYARTLITVYLKNANFVDTARLIDRIDEYERAELAPQGIKLGLAGDVAVSQTLIGAIVSTQVTSLLVSLVGIWAVTAVLGRSPGWGVYCVLPCALAVLINFAVMGWVNMPLGVATSMFAGMTLGIGVDFAIHLLERYRFARRRGLETEPAIVDAVTATGPAIIIDGLGVALGFGVLALSQVPANARLGGLVVLSIVGCLAATLVVLPALLRIWHPRAVGR